MSGPTWPRHMLGAAAALLAGCTRCLPVVASYYQWPLESEQIACVYQNFKYHQRPTRSGRCTTPQDDTLLIKSQTRTYSMHSSSRRQPRSRLEWWAREIRQPPIAAQPALPISINVSLSASGSFANSKYLSPCVVTRYAVLAIATLQQTPVFKMASKSHKLKVSMESCPKRYAKRVHSMHSSETYVGS